VPLRSAERALDFPRLMHNCKGLHFAGYAPLHPRADHLVRKKFPPPPTPALDLEAV